MFHERGGIIRAVMICIHAYCNIYIQAKEGFEAFWRRRNATRRIDALRTATADQLRIRQDVCCICYEMMEQSAKITDCGHFFHASCLRKWLYVQEKCPLCHRFVFEHSSSNPVMNAPTPQGLNILNNNPGLDVNLNNLNVDR